MNGSRDKRAALGGGARARRPMVHLAIALAIPLAACAEADDVAEGSSTETAPAADVASPLAEVRLGAVDFGAGCSADVNADFDHALGLLHHMQYDEARATFSDVARRDPACGMAQWGVAMTRFQPLWPSRPDAEALARGRRELELAREAGVRGERDEHLLAAAEAFYADPDADWWTRIRRWHEAMGEARAASPDDIETTALYALSQLAAAQIADDRMAMNASAARTLLDIYEVNPTHPGAIHYTIHANDVDGRSGESLDVVRSYGEIAPAVPHALHMPTHIFVRLGEWPDVIEWNRRSAAAALEHPAGDRISHHYPHAVDYLVYAHLQRAEDEQAAELVENLVRETQPFQPTFISAFHLAAAPARYAVERRAWAEAANLSAREPASLPWDGFWWAEAMTWFARGLGAVHTGDLPSAEAAEGRMQELRQAALEAGEAGMGQYIEIDRLILASWLAQERGDAETAVDLARRAADLEATTQKHPVTPGAIYPAHEALGDLLAAQGRPDDAIAAYDASLELWPGRLNSLRGALAAARAAGRDDRASELSRMLDRLTEGRTGDRPGEEASRTTE